MNNTKYRLRIERKCYDKTRIFYITELFDDIGSYWCVDRDIPCRKFGYPLGFRWSCVKEKALVISLNHIDLFDDEKGFLWYMEDTWGLKFEAEKVED